MTSESPAQLRPDPPSSSLQGGGTARQIMPRSAGHPPASVDLVTRKEVTPYCRGEETGAAPNACVDSSHITGGGRRP